MGAIEPWHILVLLIVVLLVLGPKRLPEVGKSVGATIREFRKATGEIRDSFSGALAPDAPAPPPPPAAVVAAAGPAPARPMAPAAPSDVPVTAALPDSTAAPGAGDAPPDPSPPHPGSSG